MPLIIRGRGVVLLWSTVWHHSDHQHASAPGRKCSGVVQTRDAETCSSGLRSAVSLWARLLSICFAYLQSQSARKHAWNSLSVHRHMMAFFVFVCVAATPRSLTGPFAFKTRRACRTVYVRRAKEWDTGGSSCSAEADRPHWSRMDCTVLEFKQAWWAPYRSGRRDHMMLNYNTTFAKPIREELNQLECDLLERDVALHWLGVTVSGPSHTGSINEGLVGTLWGFSVINW